MKTKRMPGEKVLWRSADEATDPLEASDIDFLEEIAEDEYRRRIEEITDGMGDGALELTFR